MSDEFSDWIESYPESIRNEFHRDGIVDEEAFAKERRRLLFVAKEPNSKGGNYDRFIGADLRRIWREERLRKPFDYNVSRWTKILCDGVDVGNEMEWAEVAATIRRVAIINLKKMAGSGSEDREAICLYSFKDRAFIREQVARIGPDVILACGRDGFVSRMLWRIMNDDICLGLPQRDGFLVSSRDRSVPVFTVSHPSLRLQRQEDEAAAVVRSIRESLVRGRGSRRRRRVSGSVVC